MRKFMHLVAAAGLVLGLTGTAQAGVFDPSQSTFGLILGGLPEIFFTATPGTESLVVLDNLPGGGGHFVGAETSVWSTINFGPGTSLFTGVPLISNLKVTVHNQNGVLFDGFDAGTNPLGGGQFIGIEFGGVLRLTGVTVIHSLGGNIQLPTPLSHVGGLWGETTMVTLIGNNITATNGPFITSVIKITGVTSNIITVPNRGNAQGVAFTLQPTPAETIMTLSTNGGYASLSGGLALENHMVTITGTNNLLSGSKAGSVTVIAPLRVSTGAIAGNIPGSVTLHFEFVPEPGTMLLLVSGAVGLAVIGRRRMRK